MSLNTQTINNFLQNLGFKKVINDSLNNYYTHKTTNKQIKVSPKLDVISFLEKNGETVNSYYLKEKDLKNLEKLIINFTEE